MIRAYSSADADRLWALKQGFERGLGTETGSAGKAARYERKLDDAYRDSYLEWVDRCMAEELNAVQLLEQDDSVVGYVFVLPATLSHIWDGGVINELYVEPAFRGDGLGDRLMDAALEVLREQDLPLDRVLLDVDQSNERAKSLYESYGFEHWGEMLALELDDTPPG